MIDLNIKGDKTKASTNYNYEVYQELKNVPSSEYDLLEDAWEVDSKHIKQLIINLHKMNFNVTEQLRYINENIDIHDSYDIHSYDEIIKTVKINVLKENEKSIVIGFDYDPKVLSIVKETEQRAYVKKDQAWRIRKTEVDWLYKKLEELEYIDISGLLEFSSYAKEVNYFNVTKDDFPKIKITPYDYQIDSANTLLREKKIINALQAGLGKTAITIMVCEYLKKKTLIVCPASVKENWKKEIHQINEDADVTVLYSGDEWSNSQYVILNYDIMKQFASDIVSDNFEIVAFDEAHKLRGIDNRGNPSAIRGELAVKIAANMEYVFPITATPFINYTKDIFNLLKVIDHPSGDNWYTFANSYCGVQRNGFGATYNGSSKTEQLNSRLYPNYILRLKTEDHIQLPERTRSFVPVKINMSKYNKKVKEYLDSRSTLVTNGQHLVHLTAMRKELAMAKAIHAVDMAKDLLEQNKSVTLFTNYTDVAEYLYNKFSKDAVVINGETNSKDRQFLVEQFQRGAKKVFIGNIDAAGEGITLTKSHNMIVIDMHWSPVILVDQLEKRLHRISQTEPVHIQYLIVEDAVIDQRLLNMLQEKLNNSSMILDGKPTDFFTDEIIKDLSNVYIR